MPDDAKTTTGTGDEPRIARPPSPEALDVLSGAQGLIADEWVPQPPPGEGAPAEPDAPDPDAPGPPPSAG